MSIAWSDVAELQSLKGEQVSGVSFVQDYVELEFDGPVLRLLGIVSVIRKYLVKVDGDGGFERALRECVGKNVERVQEAPGGLFHVVFFEGDIVQSRSKGLENVHFMPKAGAGMLVWN
jgi:hypothetical protein